MKKIITLSLLMISFCLADQCPDLSKDDTKENKEEIKKLTPTIQKLYFDSLKNYNKKENVENNINKNNMEKYAGTYTWGELMKLGYQIEETKEENKKQELEKEYKRILTKITPENKSWCTKEGIK